jgi:hypothetical protein
LSPEFTFRPIYEAVLKDAFETLNAEEEDTGPDVPDIYASVRGVKVDGIHKDVIYYGAMSMKEETEEKAKSLFHYMCKVNIKEGTRNFFCTIDESPKTVEWRQFFFISDMKKT